MANVNDAVSNLYGSEQSDAQSKNRRMTEHSRKWSSSGLGLDAAEAEARRLEKKGTFSATMDDEAGTVTLTKDDFKAVMGKLGGELWWATECHYAVVCARREERMEGVRLRSTVQCPAFRGRARLAVALWDVLWLDSI